MKKLRVLLYLLSFVAVFAFSFFINPSISKAADCSVTSATFSPSGTQSDDWYDDEAKPMVTVDISTSNCTSRTIEVSLTEQDTGGGDDDLPDSGLDNKKITVDATNHIKLKLWAGEEGCEGGLGDDCNYYITVYGLDTSNYESDGKSGGNLRYECDTLCEDNWGFAEQIADCRLWYGHAATPYEEIKSGITYEACNGFRNPDQGITAVWQGVPPPKTCIPPKVLKDGQCVVPVANPVSTTKYQLLAPLPCTGDAASGCENGKLTIFDTAGENKIGAYLNLMIKLFIGICAVLAVVMIVMGGIEYMTTELISSKEEGKKRITHAIFGLVLALGAWTLLNTINPDLLKSDFESLAPVTVEVTLADETETAASAVTSDSTPPAGPTASCPEGIVQTRSGMYACGSIAGKIDAMIDAAKSATPSLAITGGGYRSIEAQTALRVQNCKGDTKDPKASCTPPTAIPGASRHNNGLAVDLKCGQPAILIQTVDNACFVWLKTNAGTYGLKNLASEPWHWSTDGR